MHPLLDYMNGPEAHCNNPGVGWWCCHTVDEGTTAFEGLGFQGFPSAPGMVRPSKTHQGSSSGRGAPAGGARWSPKKFWWKGRNVHVSIPRMRTP